MRVVECTGHILQVEVMSVLGVVAVVGGGCCYTGQLYSYTTEILFQTIMSGITFYHPRLGERKSRIMEEAFRLVMWKIKFVLLCMYRRADRDGDGKISVTEILTVFKVSNRSQYSINSTVGLCIT